jgi:voltage-gated potassium channel
MNLHRIAGLAGVDPSENKRARRWAQRFEWPMIIVALWIPIQWYLENTDLMPHWAAAFGDWLIWSFFVLETSILTYFVNNRSDFLRHNWMNLLIIIVGFPVVWMATPLVGMLRNLRLVVFIGVLLRVSRTAKEVLAMNRLGSTLWFAVLVVITSGIIAATLDPAIKSAGEGIWWAWVTLSTVGYGDIVPETGAGRLFAGILILIGVGLFSLLTANISAFLIGQGAKKEEMEMRYRLRDVQERLERIEKILEQQNRQDNNTQDPPSDSK